MTKDLKWRLSKLPTPDEVRELVKDKIITQEEARDILFSQVDERDKESLEEEIKFLRTLVDKLSNKSQLIETIKYIEKPYYQYNWWKPYEVWCSSSNVNSSVTNAINPGYDDAICTANGTMYLSTNCQDMSFKDIQTF